MRPWTTTDPRMNAAMALDVAREHAAVREAVSRLRAELERLRAEPGPSHALGRVAGMLVMFRVHLARHFALEEQSPFLGLDARDPGLRRRVEELLDEHRALEDEIGELVAATQRVAAGDAELTVGFAPAAEAFLTHLERHEHVENLLVLEIVQRDAGEGD